MIALPHTLIDGELFAEIKQKTEDRIAALETERISLTAGSAASEIHPTLSDRPIVQVSPCIGHRADERLSTRSRFVLPEVGGSGHYFNVRTTSQVGQANSAIARTLT